MARREVANVVRSRMLRLSAAARAGAVGALVVVLAACSGGGGQSTRSSPAPPAPASASRLQQQYIDVVKSVGPSVVQVRDSQGLGSGIVFDTQGDIVTNDHVVRGASGFQILLVSGKTYPATLVGTFPPDDLAVLRIKATGLHPATFADSSKVQVGQIVLAIGSPLGLASSVTQGIVSAAGRTVTEPQGNAIPNVIQTSAAINPGNSGGALVDLDGRVIGIPTLAATDPELGGSAPGIGFAIPSNMAKDIAQQLVQHGHVVDSHRAYLGATVGDTNAGGVLVVSVASGGPADKAGIAPGDLILAVNGTRTPTEAALGDALVQLKPGQTVKVSLMHQDGSRATVQVTLGEYPGATSG